MFATSIDASFFVWACLLSVSLCQVLIGDEPEPGMENLLEVEIPEDVVVKLKDMDAKEQEQLEKDQEDLLNPDKPQQCAGIVRMM